MRIVILTQNDCLVLPGSLRYLLGHLPGGAQISAAVLFKLSPFGSNVSVVGQAMRVLVTFGLGYFLGIGARYLRCRFKGDDVKKVLTDHGIPVLDLHDDINSEESLSAIKRYRPDILISFWSNRIFGRALMDLAPEGMLNLHTSLLPRYRGVMPTFWVLRNNETHTGVSVFFAEEGIDSGPILVQKRIPIGSMSLLELMIKSKRVGMNALIEAVNLIERGDYQLQQNNDSEMTYYSFPSRNDIKEFRKQGKRFS